jgi:hypothetical protein
MYPMAIAAAADTIDIAASYVVPDELLIDALVAARRRGVRVRILLPGEHIGAETVRIASRAEWGEATLSLVGLREPHDPIVPPSAVCAQRRRSGPPRGTVLHRQADPPWPGR